MHISQQTMFNLMTRMRFLQNEIVAVPPSDIWWPKVSDVWEGVTGTELVSWIESNASVVPQNPGDLKYDATWERSLGVTPKDAGNALQIARNVFSDMEQQGFKFAATWVAQTTSKSILYPQDQIADALIQGETAVAYDGLAYFHAARPINPHDASAGTRSNLIAAKPVDPVNAPTIEAAAKNLNDACTAVRNIKDHAGRPAGVFPYAVLFASALADRFQTILNAAWIPAGGTGGTVDRTGQDSSVWYKRLMPIEATELGAAFGGSDVDYYLLCKTRNPNLPPGVGYLEREGFKIQFWGPDSDSALDAQQVFEWRNRGRATAFYGDPMRIVKVKAT